jgi:hypothetical protein
MSDFKIEIEELGSALIKQDGFSTADVSIDEGYLGESDE